MAADVPTFVMPANHAVNVARPGPVILPVKLSHVVESCQLLQTLENNQTPSITDALADIRQDLHKIMVLTAQTNNIHCLDGSNRPFKLIPLPNRHYAHLHPDPMALPALLSAPDLMSLSDNQLNLYLSRYGISPENRQAT
ncbi:hypothetical protein ARMSODRAFT_1028037 [Armillaria solidipes]|uniref:Mug135-like C-terminal domain-containing protein n=1 Tax=Armillaria solidipes TaxID=1076256 RepID=A0A2H3AIA3_9AGAR|nr:hypothetical protein ARMSODRAFT_1028037 [Armillaria solidipes]